MTHVSSKKLDYSLMEKLFNKLFVIFENARNKNSVSLVVNELFTGTEKVMFAKRLAIILMLDSKIPQHRIVNLLKVSPTTVAKISLGIELGKYNTILRISKKDKIDLEKVVWNILTVGGMMPPKIGKKYWTKYYKNK